MKGKRILCALCALLLALPVGALAQENYTNIAALGAQDGTRWQQTYKTEWRDVDIDAEIRVPQADKAPVMLIEGGVADPGGAPGDWTGYYRYDGPYSLVLNREAKDYPKSVDGKRVAGPTAKGNWYSDFKPENTYVPMHDITFGELTELVREELGALGYDADAYDLDTPTRLWAHHIYEAGTRTDILPGYIFSQYNVKTAGIPILCHIFDGVRNPRGEQGHLDEYMNTVQLSVTFDGYNDKITSMFIRGVKPVEVLSDDVPLLPMERIFGALESEIKAGKLRKVYSLELGYVMFNEPGVYRPKGLSSEESLRDAQARRYYVKPMWQVKCIWKDSARAEREVTETDDERNVLDYRELLIDAQTGELVQISDAHDRCEFNGYVDWDNVK